MYGVIPVIVQIQILGQFRQPFSDILLLEIMVYFLNILNMFLKVLVNNTNYLQSFSIDYINTISNL